MSEQLDLQAGQGVNGRGRIKKGQKNPRILREESFLGLLREKVAVQKTNTVSEVVQKKGPNLFVTSLKKTSV